MEQLQVHSEFHFIAGSSWKDVLNTLAGGIGILLLSKTWD